MSPLAYVWIAAVGLTCFSLATMISLIGARLVHAHGQARRAARRALVLPELIHHIGGLTGASINLAGLERDAVLMAEIVRDLAGIVKGPERTRLMAALATLKVDERLRELLRRGWANQRVLAAEALVFFPCVETYAALQKASRSAQVRVRLPALRTLIDLDRAPPLGQLLEGIASGSQRASLLFSDLLQRAARSQIDAAIAAYGDDLPRHARIVVIQALGSTGDSLALAPLCDAAASPDAEIRTAALAAIGALGQPGAEKVVAAGLADQDWSVRLKAIECVRRLGLTEFAAAVLACAEDEVWWVRYRAGQTVASLAEQEVARLKEFVGAAAGSTRPPARVGETIAAARAVP